MAKEKTELTKEYLIALLQEEFSEIIAHESEIRHSDKENKNFLCYDFTIKSIEVVLNFSNKGYI